MDSKIIKDLLSGGNAGMTNDDIVANSRGTYFEKFVDEILAAREQMAKQKEMERLFAQKLMGQMKAQQAKPPRLPYGNTPPQIVSDVNSIFPDLNKGKQRIVPSYGPKKPVLK